MKHSTILIFVLLFSVPIFGQIKVEKIMERRVYTCPDIYYNTSYLFPKLYANNSYDSIISILDFWDTNCGVSEVSMRCRILTEINNNTFSEDIYKDNIIEYLFYYKQKVQCQNFYRNNSNRYIVTYNNLDKFTKKTAKELLKKENLSQTEIILLKIYSNDFKNTFSEIKSKKCDSTKLQKSYFKEVKKYNKKFKFHGAFLLGVWMPQNNLSIVGNHPSIGVKGGIISKKMTANVGFGFKFLQSPNTYKVYKNDSVWDTNHFFGGYLELDLGRKIFTINKNRVDIFGGIGIDGFDALDVKTPNEKTIRITKSINSLNLNLGLGYKYYYSNNGYLGFDLKYNFLNLKNKYGNDLSGNAITINFIIGFLGTRYHDRMLKELEFNN